jgi:hypothetical protein
MDIGRAWMERKLLGRQKGTRATEPYLPRSEQTLTMLGCRRVLHIFGSSQSVFDVSFPFFLYSTHIIIYHNLLVVDRQYLALIISYRLLYVFTSIFGTIGHTRASGKTQITFLYLYKRRKVSKSAKKQVKWESGKSRSIFPESDSVLGTADNREKGTKGRQKRKNIMKVNKSRKVPIGVNLNHFHVWLPFARLSKSNSVVRW